MTTAREFFDQMADTLRAKGREVQITETEESFGTFVWLYAPAPHWYQRSLSLSVVQRKGRWNLGQLTVGSSVSGGRNGRGFKRTTRSDIRIAIDVYA